MKPKFEINQNVFLIKNFKLRSLTIVGIKIAAGKFIYELNETNEDGTICNPLVKEEYLFSSKSDLMNYYADSILFKV